MRSLTLIITAGLMTAVPLCSEENGRPENGITTIVGTLLDTKGDPSENKEVTLCPVKKKNGDFAVSMVVGEGGVVWNPSENTDSTGSFALDVDMTKLGDPKMFIIDTSFPNSSPARRNGKPAIFVVAEAPGVEESDEFTVVSVVPDQDGKRIDVGELTLE